MFTKLSKKIFYKLKEEKEDGLIKTIGDNKVVIIFDYIYINTGLNGNCNTILEHMIKECGYTPNNDKGKINDQFRNILNTLKEKNLICSEESIINIKPKQFFILRQNLDLTNSFIQLYDTEKEKILNQTIKKIDNIKLLTYYCYIKARMYKRKKDEYLHLGGKPETCYFGYKDINYDLGLSTPSIKSYNDILVALDLIRIDNAGLWYYASDENKKVCESNNTYTLFQDGWEEELKESMSRYKKMKSDRVFINTRTYKKNNKSENGYIARIQTLEREGKASQLQIYKKNRLIEKRNNIGGVDITFEIMTLLNKEENKNKLLSEIYDEQGKSNYSEKYYKIEDSLELFNFENDEWLVDWDYYKYIISNYKEEEYDKFVNYVKKHKKEMDK